MFVNKKLFEAEVDEFIRSNDQTVLELKRVQDRMDGLEDRMNRLMDSSYRMDGLEDRMNRLMDYLELEQVNVPAKKKIRKK